VTPSAHIASLLLDTLHVEGKPDLWALCRHLGLRVREVDSTGFEGALVRSRGAQKGIIALKRTIREASRKRFTIAHEIGHFVIPHHRLLGNVCESLSRFDKGLAAPELEANEFAAELLLPSRLVRSRFDPKEPTLAGIRAVAREFDTSLTATAYRYLELSDLRCVMVWSEAHRVVWYRRSESFPFYLPASDLPARESLAGRLLAGEAVPGGLHKVSPELWLDTRDAARVHLLLEDALFFPNYNAVLSMLWIAEMEAGGADSDRDDLLPELDPEEFTLRRKRWPSRH
jgi:hypothetical protein